VIATAALDTAGLTISVVAITSVVAIAAREPRAVEPWPRRQD
jgi:hypothetical protein